MDKTINISTFKAQCIAILNDLHQHGGSLTVTNRGKPLVRIGSAEESRSDRKFGAGRESGQIMGDICSTDSLLECEMDLRNLDQTK